MFQIFEWLGQILEATFIIMMIASIITALTPTPKDDEAFKKVLDSLSFLRPYTAPGTLKLPFTRTKA